MLLHPSQEFLLFLASKIEVPDALRTFPMRAMTPLSNFTLSEYLDPFELAQLLGESVRAVRLRARHRPWLLPPRAGLYDRELLRWRHDVVDSWIASVSLLDFSARP